MSRRRTGRIPARSYRRTAPVVFSASTSRPTRVAPRTAKSAKEWRRRASPRPRPRHGFRTPSTPIHPNERSPDACQWVSDTGELAVRLGQPPQAPVEVGTLDAGAPPRPERLGPELPVVGKGLLGTVGDGSDG